jgi:hypothetical protein
MEYLSISLISISPLHQLDLVILTVSSHRAASIRPPHCQGSQTLYATHSQALKERTVFQTLLWMLDVNLFWCGMEFVTAIFVALITTLDHIYPAFIVIAVAVSTLRVPLSPPLPSSHRTITPPHTPTHTQHTHKPSPHR